MSFVGQRHGNGKGGDRTDGAGRRHSSKGTFWSSLRGKPQRSPAPAAGQSTPPAAKKPLTKKISTASTPEGNYQHQQDDGGTLEVDNHGPKRSKSLRERTGRAIQRVARRVSRRRRHPHDPHDEDHHPSPSHSSSSSVRPDSRATSDGHYPVTGESHGLSGLVGRGANGHSVASRGEATFAEYTDNSNRNLQRLDLVASPGPGIEVTEASVPDISALVQQLTDRAGGDASTTPSGSPALRRRAYTSNDSTKPLSGMLHGPRKWLSRNRLVTDWAPSEDGLSWQSPDGEVIASEERNVLALSVIEHRTLRKNLHKQLESELGFSFPVPKDPDAHRIGGRTAALVQSKLVPGADKSNGWTERCVFGIPLHRVLENDRAVTRKKQDIGKLFGDGLTEASSSNSLDDTCSDHHSSSEDADENDEPDAVDSQLGCTVMSLDDHFNGDHFLLSEEAASVSALDLESDAIPPDGAITRTFSLSESVANPIPMAPAQHHHNNHHHNHHHHHHHHHHNNNNNKKSHNETDNNPNFLATAGVLGLATAPLQFLGRSADNLLKDTSGTASLRGMDDITLSRFMKEQKKAQARLQSRAEVELRVREHKKEVPEFLLKAFDFLKEHGMQTVGIFRVAGSKRRYRQIQEDFDNGFEIAFMEGIHQPSDVASLVKNFLRDLPDPLLTRALYPAFVAASKISDPDQQAMVLRQLICLLPMCNRDTLHELLCFLRDVAKHAEDRVVDGETIPGHKMDTSNLALVIGPNIMRPYKGKPRTEFKAAGSQDIASTDYIHGTVMSLITLNTELFRVPASLHHEVLLVLKQKAPALLEAILQKHLGRSPAVRRANKVSSSSSSEFPGSPVGAGSLGSGSVRTSRGSLHPENKEALPGHNLLATVLQGTPPRATKQDQHSSVAKFCSPGEDFSEFDKDTGKLIPTFALPGSPPGDNSGGFLVTSPLEILTMRVQDMTPPEFRRRIPERSRSQDFWSGKIRPAEDALFGNWHHRWPSSEDNRPRSSSTEKKPVSGTESAALTVDDSETHSRSKSTLRDESMAKGGEMSPVSGEATPLADLSRSLGSGHMDTTPMAQNDTMLSDQTTPSQENVTPLRRTRFSLRGHKSLGRRNTEPSPRLSKDADALVTQKSRNKFQQLKNYFENIHVGSAPAHVDSALSAEDDLSPHVTFERYGSEKRRYTDAVETHVVIEQYDSEKRRYADAMEPGNRAGEDDAPIWRRFHADDKETMV